jgi:DNA-binding PadR family transcriptional regulator
MARARVPDLSLTEWAVLALTAEQATHGFAISKELAPEGDLGRIWTVPRPLVYRALATLERSGLVESLGEEAGDRGPTRTRVRATRAGRTAVDRWLALPVPHVRELRTRLLLQLRLLDRRGLEVYSLAAAQLVELGPILGSLEDRMASTVGFDRLLAAWRFESAQAAARFLEGVVSEQDGRSSGRASAKQPRRATGRSPGSRR